MLHGQTRFALASRFLSEIPETLLKWTNKGYAPVTKFNTRSSFSSQQENDTGLKLGQSVKHPKFGLGVITQFEGSRKGANVEVNFAQ